MRHIRTRRRYKVILLFLMALCATLLLENRIEALVPDLKMYAEERVEKVLGGRMSLSIGSIHGGLVNPIVLDDITIRQAKDKRLFRSLTINSIKTNYRIWNLLKLKSFPAITDIIDKDSAVFVNFSIRDGDITGFAGIEGDLANSRVSGYVRIPGQGKIGFTATVAGDNFDVLIRPDSGTMRLTGKIDDSGELNADFRIEHLKLFGFDLVCDGRLKNRMIVPNHSSPKGCMEGELETSRLVLNFKPFLELKTAYSLSDGVMTLRDMRFGEAFKISGSFGFKKPNPIDLTLLVNNVSLSWLFQQFGSQSASAAFITGTMNGKFTCKGPAKALKVGARFDLRKGTIATLGFDYLGANLKGDLPFLKIEDARVTRPSGYLEIAGEFDLRRIGKNSFFENIRLVTDDGAITWDDWSSVRRQDVQEINMTKSITSDIGISYKKFVADQKVDESMRDADTLKFEYKLNSQESLGVKVGQDENFFGFEHKDKF